MADKPIDRALQRQEWLLASRVRQAIADETPPRVAFVSEHASPLAVLGGQDGGGQNVYVDEVSRNLGRLGFQVDVFTRWEDARQPEVVEVNQHVRVVQVQAGPRELLPKDDLWPLMPEFYRSMLGFMERDGGGYHIAHGNFWMSGWVVAQLRQQLGLPAVQIFHAMGKTKQRHQGEDDTSPDGRIEIENEVVRGVDRIIAQCPSEAQELIEDYSADARDVALIPSAVNVERFRPLERAEACRRTGIDVTRPTIVYVGRLLPRKDVRNIVRALALLLSQHDWQNSLPQLVIVGGATAEPDPVATPELAVLQDLAAEFGVSEHVRFIGGRPPEQLHSYYSASHVVVTTPWYEPFGLTPLEAMACARPVIGADVGGISFTVQDGVTGFLVPPRDPAALATRLHALLTNPAQAQQMGRAARARVEGEFTWPVVAKRTAALYTSLLADQRAATTEAALAAFELGA